MPGPQRQVAARGFTLVEVVVSLAVLSLIMLATVTALRTFANTQSTLERTTGRVDEMRTVTSFLRDMVEASVIGADGSSGLTLGGGNTDIAYFRGGAEAMEWKATVKFGETYGGKFILRVSRQGDELVLQWQDSPRRLYDLDWSDAQSRLLVSDVDELSLAYRLEPRGPWEAVLDDEVVPSMVRVRLKVRGLYWPDLVMAVPQ